MVMMTDKLAKRLSQIADVDRENRSAKFPCLLDEDYDTLREAASALAFKDAEIAALTKQLEVSKGMYATANEEARRAAALRPVSDEAVEAAARRIAKLFGDPDYCVEGSGSTGGDFTCTKRAWQTFIPHAHAALAHTGKVGVKPLDLSNLLKHAFLSGVVAAREIPPGDECDGPSLWVEYDPEPCAAYDRIRSALQTGGET